MVKHSGMRNGISLVEMMIAIILFGVITVLAFQYYKNFINTDLSAQKARVATLVDQARQLSSAYDVYRVQTGDDLSDISDLYSDNIMILTGPMPIIDEIAPDASNGWEIYDGADFDSSGTNDLAFRYPVVGGALGLSYCNVFNNMIDPDYELTTAVGDLPNEGNAWGDFGETFCYEDGGDRFITLIKEVR